MSEELVQFEQLKLDIIDAIISGQVNTADDITAMFNIPSNRAIGLLNDPTFLTALTNASKAKLVLVQHSKGTNRLAKCLDSDNDQIAMKAYELISKVTGTLKTGPSVEINFNLESLLDDVEKKEKKVSGPVYDLSEFDIEKLASE